MAERPPFLAGERVIEVTPELNGRTLTTRVRVSRDLRWYFRNWQFVIRYDRDIHAAEPVLSIPGVALLLPLAWLTGADLRVRRLDRRFHDAAEALQQAYRAVYPRMPFGTRLLVDELVDSPANPEGTAMLFSGGLDATYSFYANRERNPLLVQVFGTEFPDSATPFLDRVTTESSAFASRHGVPITFLHTTFFALLSQPAVMHDFLRVRERVNGDLWKGLGYALGFLAMTAPLSAGRFDRLVIAAWADREHADRMRENPDASSPEIDQKIAWANLTVEHHGCLHRYEKVQAMRDWLPGTHLRVCWSFAKALEIEGALNCSRCEKCARSITALAIGGVDPRQCGFTVDGATIAAMKNLLTQGTVPPSHLAFWWGPMQRQIPEHIEDEAFGLVDFLAWLRDFDLGNGLDPRPRLWTMPRLFSLFPLPFALRVRSLVYRFKGESGWVNQLPANANPPGSSR
jgi:hypothetical protein